MSSPAAGQAVGTTGAQRRPPEDFILLTKPDRELVKAIQEGNSSAAAPLYQRLHRSIERALARVLRARPAEFEDLMQITYERIIRTIAAGNFEGRSQLTTWASAIAAHVAVDWLRKRSQEQKLFLSTDACPEEQALGYQVTERRLEARSEVRHIHMILGRMNPRRAGMLVMHDALGHSVPQVAELLGIKVSTAQSRLRRAREEFARRHAASLPAQAIAAAAYPCEESQGTPLTAAFGFSEKCGELGLI